MRRNGRIDALVAATDALEMLSIDQTKPVDPFDAIEALGLQLTFAKLDNLLGAVVPDGTGGVLLTTQRGPAIQRFTAAHEIGHWVLHQQRLSVDDETNILGSSQDEAEIEAQLFAGYFLMPEPLFRSAVERHSLRRHEVRPEQVYLLGRDMKVSYEAAARRLLTSGLLTYPEFTQVVKVSRLQALRRAFGDRRPVVGAADLWDGSPTDGHPRSLAISENDEVIIHLPEHRLSGWRWLSPHEMEARQRRIRSDRPRPSTGNAHDGGLRDRPAVPLVVEAPPAPSHRVPSQRDVRPMDAVNATALDPQELNILEDSFTQSGFAAAAGMIQRRNAPRRLDAHQANLPIGGVGERTIVVGFDRPGQWHLQLHYSHAYDPAVDPLLTYELTVGVQPTPLHAFHQRRLTGAELDQRLLGDPEDDAEFEVLG